MAYNSRPPYASASPKIETVIKKTSIQREYMVKHSSTEALNQSNASIPSDGVTSDSFIPHGFYDRKPQDSFAGKEEKQESTQNEDTISHCEREVQKVSELLRNLSTEFINDIADTGVRYGRQVNQQANSGASEASSKPTSKTTLFKSFFERSRDAHGESTTQEFSSERGYEERDIDEVLGGKRLLAHSTKKPTARGSDSGDSGLEKGRLFSDRKGASKDVFSRYENLSDVTRRVCTPCVCLILLLLSLLLALFIGGLVWYLLNEKRLDDCREELKAPLELFCRLKPPAMHFNFSRIENIANSGKQYRIKYVKKALCDKDPLDLDHATNLTRTFLDSVDKSLWPTVGDVMYFKPLLHGEPIYFNVTAKEASATFHLLKQGTHENSYLPAMQKALEAVEYMRNDPDNRHWMALETEFFEATNGEKILSSEKINTSPISYEGSPQEFYWSLRLATRCKRQGSAVESYFTYQRELHRILEKMKC